MKKRYDRKYILFFGFTMALLLALGAASSSLKSSAVFWLGGHKESPPSSHLALENVLLRQQLEKARDLLEREFELLSDRDTIGIISVAEIDKLDLHVQETAALFPKKVEALPADVVYRSPHSWNSSLWINRGSAQGIKRDSPVLSGTSLIGIVEDIHTNRSKVRLITDPRLSPSVRASRGGEKLAKGELHGSALTAWRSRGILLKGEGFNYDFDDEYGHSRDMRDHETPILKVGDLLVTTGMDGIFPAGLEVATVTKISPLREGDYYYELEALPTAENLEEITTVFVLPPLAD